MAPTDAPKTRSARMSRAMSSWSMPTWTAPRLPPPARTNAVRRAGRCRPSPTTVRRWCAGAAPTRRGAGRYKVGGGAGPVEVVAVGTSLHVAAAPGVRGGCAASGLLAGPPRLASRDVVAHRPQDHDHHEREHRHHEDPEDHEEGGVAGRRQQEGGCHVRLRVEECHTPWAHCTDGPRRTPSAAPACPSG